MKKSLYLLAAVAFCLALMGAATRMGAATSSVDTLTGNFIGNGSGLTNLNIINRPDVVVFDDLGQGGAADVDFAPTCALYANMHNKLINLVGVNCVVPATNTLPGVSVAEIIGNVYGVYPSFGYGNSFYAVPTTSATKFTDPVYTNFPSRIGCGINAQNEITVARAALIYSTNRLIFVSSGEADGLADLWTSSGGLDSPLTGKQLMLARKPLLIIMAGNTNSAAAPESNLLTSRADALSSLMEMCGQLTNIWVCFELGTNVTTLTGPFLGQMSVLNPVYQAMVTYQGAAGRFSWDSIAGLYAGTGNNVFGSNIWTQVFGEISITTNTGTPTLFGSNVWSAPVTGLSSFIEPTNQASYAYISNILNQFMIMSPPKAGMQSTLPFNYGIPNCAAWRFSTGTGTSQQDWENANTLSLTGSPSWALLNGRQTLALNGSTQYGSAANSSTMQPANAISVAAYVNDSSVAANQTIISRPYRTSGWSAPFASYVLAVGAVANEPYFGVTVGGTLYTVVSTVPLVGSQNHSIIGTYDGNGTIAIFQDGVLTGTNNVPGGGAIDYSGGAANVDVGVRSEYSTGEFFPGNLYKVCIYNHNLNPIEVQSFVRDFPSAQ